MIELQLVPADKEGPAIWVHTDTPNEFGQTCMRMKLQVKYCYATDKNRFAYEYESERQPWQDVPIVLDQTEWDHWKGMPK